MSKQQRNREYYSRHRLRIAAKMAERARVNRREAEAQFGGKCQKCGSTIKLQFDHIDCKTKDSHKIWTWSPARRAAELAKCQLICEACHIIKTVEHDEHQWKSRIIDVD